MRRLPPFLRFTGTIIALVALTGCTYEAAVQRLTPPEQAAFRAYSKVMTPAQAHTYLARVTAVERAAYLEELGITARFQALAPQEREAVLAGQIRQGMSAEALRFLWGEPYYTEGYTGHYEHWYYLGSSFSLAAHGSRSGSFSTMVDVYLVDGRVDWWLEFVPSGPADENGEGRRN